MKSQSNLYSHRPPGSFDQQFINVDFHHKARKLKDANISRTGNIKQKEEDFNIYFRGANEERIKQQIQKKIYPKHSNQGLPKKTWKSPSCERPIESFHQFQGSSRLISPSPNQINPPLPTKKWNNRANSSQQDRSILENLNNFQINFAQNNNVIPGTSDLPESANETKFNKNKSSVQTNFTKFEEHNPIIEVENDDDLSIKHILENATKQEIDMLRESLTSMKEILKMQQMQNEALNLKPDNSNNINLTQDSNLLDQKEKIPFSHRHSYMDKKRQYNAMNYMLEKLGQHSNQMKSTVETNYETIETKKESDLLSKQNISAASQSNLMTRNISQIGHSQSHISESEDKIKEIKINRKNSENLEKTTEIVDAFRNLNNRMSGRFKDLVKKLLKMNYNQIQQLYDVAENIEKSDPKQNEVANLYTKKLNPLDSKLPEIFSQQKPSAHIILSDESSNSKIEKIEKIEKIQKAIKNNNPEEEDKKEKEKEKEMVINLTNKKQSSQLQKEIKEEINANLNDKKKSSIPSPQIPITKDQEILLKIHSTWGHPHIAGLAEIKILDKMGIKINVPSASIIVRNASGTFHGVSQLFNNAFLSFGEKNMWTCNLPNPPLTLEIVICLPKGKEVGGLTIFNYNKSLLDTNKGVKDFEVFVNGKSSWRGIIKKGSGNSSDELCTEIKLDEKFVFPTGTQSKGLTIPEDLQKIKEQISSIPKPISVPIWLIDSGLESSKNPMTNRNVQICQIQKENEIKHLLEKRSRPHQLAGESINQTYSKEGKEKQLPQKELSHPAEKDKIEPFISKIIQQEDEKNVNSNNFSKNDNIFNYQKLNEETSFSTKPRKNFKDLTQPLDILKDNRKKNTIQDDSLESLEFFKFTHMGRIDRINTKPKDSPKLNLLNEKDDALHLLIEQQSKQPDVLKNLNETFLDIQNIVKGLNNFSIPSLPKGKKCQIDILSTWGDSHYVGLCGIEMFDGSGSIINVSKENVRADPSDINILEGYGKDPRTVDKLFDGVNFTRDDEHVWLAPYNLGKRHYIEIDLVKINAISMIRIWNYNKSRIHSFRGVKDLLIRLDNVPIFIGEIRKSTGILADPSQCCEIILFTDSLKILDPISTNDWINKIYIDCKEIEGVNEERPHTTSRYFNKQEIDEMQKAAELVLGEERPPTTANVGQNLIKQLLAQKDKELKQYEKEELAKKEKKQKIHPEIMGQYIDINILETWGDLFYVGLTGIQIIGNNDKPLAIMQENITANPRDMNTIPGNSGDYRTIDKLIDNINITNDDRHMWLIPFSPGENHLISISLQSIMPIKGMKFYNYNKSEEDTFRGARKLTISIDGISMTPKAGITIRKALGTADFDYGQIIYLPFNEGWDTDSIIPLKQNLFPIQKVVQESCPPYLPMGYIFTIKLWSSYGDSYYIGLNGIEFYDQFGNSILSKKEIKYTLNCNPSSVNSLKGMEKDTRTADKLVDGINETFDDTHMWLAPFNNTKIFAVTNKVVSSTPNEIDFIFEHPIAISVIRIWNYSKSIARGAKEIDILCDGNLIYRGYIKVAPQNYSKNIQDNSTSILFTSNEKIINNFTQFVNFTKSKEQDVAFTNEGNIVKKFAAEKSTKLDIERPFTSVAGKLK